MYLLIEQLSGQMEDEIWNLLTSWTHHSYQLSNGRPFQFKDMLNRPGGVNVIPSAFDMCHYLGSGTFIICFFFSVLLNQSIWYRRANFTSADMRESDFSGSTFNGAYLEKAVAYKANFSGKSAYSSLEKVVMLLKCLMLFSKAYHYHVICYFILTAFRFWRTTFCGSFQ